MPTPALTVGVVMSKDLGPFDVAVTEDTEVPRSSALTLKSTAYGMSLSIACVNRGVVPAPWIDQNSSHIVVSSLLIKPPCKGERATEEFWRDGSSFLNFLK